MSSANDRLPLAIPPRDRFVRAIAERVVPERIAEVHLFQPIRQGGVETGVAVIAVEPTSDDPSATTDTTGSRDESDAATFLADEEGRRDRHNVLTAWYRLTLKGPDRGKWEFNLADEALAPLETIVAVARGVGQRAGDADDPERWTGDHFRTALGEASGG